MRHFANPVFRMCSQIFFIHHEYYRLYTTCIYEKYLQKKKKVIFFIIFLPLDIFWMLINNWITACTIKTFSQLSFDFLFQVLDVLCSLCVCNGVAVRANQNLICDNLLPRRDLLLQTRLINDVTRYCEIVHYYIRRKWT